MFPGLVDIFWRSMDFPRSGTVGSPLQRRGVMRVCLGVGLFVFLHGKLPLFVANALQNNGGTESEACSVLNS